MTYAEYLKKILLLLRGQLNNQKDLNRELADLRVNVRQAMPGNPVGFGYKIYSQCDEDGIIQHIFNVIGASNRYFVEIGCSDGLENNTHALLLDGWHGTWIDADHRKIKRIKKTLPVSDRLLVMNSYVTIHNARQIGKAAVQRLKGGTVDFLSVDIDGDDLNVTRLIVEAIKPRVICAEYNAKFPPHIVIAVRQGTGSWQGDDYQGASLAAFVDMLVPAGYRLVACGLSGVNAFFVNDRESIHFPVFDLKDLYQPPRYWLCQFQSGHRPSLKYLSDSLLNQ